MKAFGVALTLQLYGVRIVTTIRRLVIHLRLIMVVLLLAGLRLSHLLLLFLVVLLLALHDVVDDHLEEQSHTVNGHRIGRLNFGRHSVEASE